MKTIRVTLAASLSVAALLSLVSCDKKAESTGASSATGAAASGEGAAIEALKKYMGEIKALKEKGDAAQKGGNPMAMIPELRNFMTKIGGIPTDGLPADLKATMEKGKALFKEAGDVILPALKDIPTDEAGIAKWTAELQADPTKAAGIMAAMGKIGPAMQALEPKKDALEAEMKPLLKKYNLPEDFLGDDKKEGGAAEGAPAEEPK